jgi:hypothetical protein
MASALLTERRISSDNTDLKQIRGRTNIQDGGLKERSRKVHDTTSANQSLNNKLPRDVTVQTPHTIKPYKSAPNPPATAAKPHDTWKAELMEGMALLSQRIPKNFLPKKASSNLSPKND